MQRLFIICLLLGTQWLWGQRQQQIQAPSRSPVENNISGLLAQARDSLMDNLPFAVQASQKAIQLAKSNSLIRSEQQCYLALADFYKTYEKYDLCIRNYDRAIDLGLPNSTELHYKKLPYLEKISDQEKAIQDANYIVKLARKQKNDDARAEALIVLGNIYAQKGDYDRSNEYLEEADQIASRANPRQRAYAQAYIGDNFSRQNKNDIAESYYKNSISYNQVAQDTELIVDNFDRMNQLLKQQNRSSDLITYNNTVLDDGSQKSTDKDSLQPIPAQLEQDYWPEEVQQRANINLASAYLDNKTPEKAIDILERLEDQEENPNLEQSGQIHRLLSEAYDKSGRYSKAIEEYKTFVAIQDSLLKEKDARLQEEMQKNLTLQALENQILLLEKDRELDSKTLALNESNMRTQRTVTFAVLIVALVTLLSLVLVMRKNKSKTVAYDLLALKSLRTKMNPHFIFNSLNSVNHYIAQNDEKSANKFLSQFARLMREVLDHSDKDFIPLDREIELLEVYLALEHQRFSDKFDYTFEVDPAVKGEDYQIPPMLVQPFIENAIWHGLRYVDTGGQLAVRFLQKEGHLLIEVEDNGIGRAASKALKTKSQTRHKSSGISASQSRIDLSNKVYGNSLSIQIIDKSGDSSGTLVQITLKEAHAD